MGKIFDDTMRILKGGKPRDENMWNKAKAAAKKQYPDIAEDDDKFWKIVNGIYTTMTKNIKKAEINPDLGIVTPPDQFGPSAGARSTYLQLGVDGGCPDDGPLHDSGGAGKGRYPGAKRRGIQKAVEMILKGKTPVKNPGSRGGKYYRDERGNVRYGVKPVAGEKRIEFDNIPIEKKKEIWTGLLDKKIGGIQSTKKSLKEGEDHLKKRFPILKKRGWDSINEFKDFVQTYVGQNSVSSDVAKTILKHPKAMMQMYCGVMNGITRKNYSSQQERSVYLKFANHWLKGIEANMGVISNKEAEATWSKSISSQVLSIMKGKTPVKNPGSRGGKYYRDERGNVRYGVKPEERVKKKNEAKKNVAKIKELIDPENQPYLDCNDVESVMAFYDTQLALMKNLAPSKAPKYKWTTVRGIPRRSDEVIEYESKKGTAYSDTIWNEDKGYDAIVRGLSGSEPDSLYLTEMFSSNGLAPSKNMVNKILVPSGNIETHVVIEGSYENRKYVAAHINGATFFSWT